MTGPTATGSPLLESSVPSRADAAVQRLMGRLFVAAALAQLDADRDRWRDELLVILLYLDWSARLDAAVARETAIDSAAVLAWRRALAPLWADAASRGAAATFGRGALSPTNAVALAIRTVRAQAALIVRTTAARVVALVRREAAALAAVGVHPVDVPSLLRATVPAQLETPARTATAGPFTAARAERIGGTVSSGAAARGEFEAARTVTPAPPPPSIANKYAVGTAARSAFLAANAEGYRRIVWRHSGHPKEPRSWHVRIDGTVVRLGETFPGTTCRYPRDPDGDPYDVVNCTCSCEYLTA